MRKIIPILARFIAPIMLLALILVLFKTNYISGTWLSGWDTLHPEFNLEAYTKRVWFGSWQEHQGVGASPSQAHAAELVRIPLLYLLSLFLPLSAVRWSFMFLCLGIGVLGMYWLINQWLQTTGSTKTRSRQVAFVAALIYLCNLTVVQQFYVPLEMFAIHYAALPWIIWSVWNYWQEGKAKYLLSLSIILFLSAPQAHTSTLYYMFGLTIGLCGAIWIILQRFKPIHISRVILTGLMLVLTQAFWLFPNVYFVLNHAEDIRISTIHSTFSEEAFLQGRAYGGWGDLVVMKNFLFNWREYDVDSNSFVFLMDEWADFIGSQDLVLLASYAVMILAVIGIISGGIKKNPLVLSLLPMFLVSVFFWINANPPFTQIFLWLRENFELLKEALRFPFTKFSITYLASLTVLSAFGLNFVLKKAKSGLISWSFVGTLSLLLLAFFTPAFRGSLVSPSMKVHLPVAYQEMFAWFQTQPSDVRVAKLPLHTFWGWGFHSWDYQGAGFTWFGLDRPLFDREFDRWSPYNESFYNQLSEAVYDNDQERFIKTLQKYRVGYLFFDRSILNAGGDQKLLANETLQEFLGNSTYFSKSVTFDFIDIYEFNLVGDELVWSPENYQLINSDQTYVSRDNLFDPEIPYIQSESDGTLYPFANLDQRSSIDISFIQDQIILTQEYTEPIQAAHLYLPDFVEAELDLTNDIYVEKTLEGSLLIRFEIKTPNIIFNGDEKINGTKAWLTQIVNVDPESVGYIAINGQAFNTQLVDWNQKNNYLGTAIVSKNKDTQINTYAKESANSDSIVSGLLQQQPRICADPNLKLTTDTLAYGEFKLEVQDKSVCLGQRFNLETSSLLDISFSVESIEGLYPWFCISRVNQKGCINDVVPNDFEANNVSRDFQFLLPIDQGQYWLDFVAQAVEGATGEISYRDLSVNSYELIETRNVSLGGLFNSVSRAEKIPYDTPIHTLQAFVDNEGGMVKEDFSLTRGNFEAVNCDVDKRGSVDKQILSNYSLLYASDDNGVSCDFFDYNRLPHSSSFILRLKGQNLKGRSLKVYLQNNETGRMDVERILDAKDFDNYFLLLGTATNTSGYTLNIENSSFGHVPAENILEEISFRPIPADWLSQVRLEKNTVDQTQIIPSSLTITNYQKLSPTHYVVEVTNNQDGGLLVLDQGYERGWYAKTANVDQPLNHIRVNNWSNGWLIPQGQHVIEIRYQPQRYLILGWGVTALTLGGSVGYLLFSLYKSRFKDHETTI